MNIDLKDLPTKILPLLSKLKEYIGFIIVIAILLSYGFLIAQIRSYVINEPSETTVSEELKKLSLPKVNEEAIKQIQQLQDTNVQVQSLFDKARQNPFSE